ncbi:histidine kinase [Stackebrandtia albiflava]|uniref:histidine kinase n=1 Tax=Stackebrandtia albiflava TaxID=406432 RepID=A0A562V219_9ACTN|nr:ATP-binding protein [Stackebrandtia albiflava]TWJ11885.1 histidine kinase [Stackebrandtia albiflava]
MTSRRLFVVAGVAALTAGAVLLPSRPLDYMVTPVLGCLGLAALLWWWPSRRRLTAPVVCAAGVMSLLVTLHLVAGPRPGSQPVVPTTLWMMLEPLVLTVTVYLAVRWSPPRPAVAAAVLAAAGTGVQVHRFPVFSPWWEGVAGSLLWTLPALAAAAAGWYLRDLSRRRAAAVEEARRVQRWDLAADLHDFVAHDVSEIVAQAQAAREVLALEPPAAAVLERIETAGLRALTSMDSMVGVLRGRDGPSATPSGGVADIPALVERFGAAGRTAARLKPEVPPQVPREVGNVAYRVVVEALTNVRRHAPGARTVTVGLTVVADRLRTTVTDDGGGRPEAARSSGLGLAGLTERVESVGGELTAGPYRGGWRVVASLPCGKGAVRGGGS